MNANHLNEHDANQGAQSSGEFLGMTGNSGWYLLGSAGATLLMVVFLWGVFKVSLLLCLFVGLVLCGLSLVYVFTLKNNRPEHYDTDFFESALVEAGVMAFRFGPRARRPVNPFTGAEIETMAIARRSPARAPRAASSVSRSRTSAAPARAAEPEPVTETAKTKVAREKPEPMVARAAYDRLQEKLMATEEVLADALAEAMED